MKLVSLVAVCLSIFGVGIAGCGDGAENKRASPVTPIARESSTTSGERQGSDTQRLPTHCDSISEMIELAREYSEEDGTFRMLEKGPTPHFQISPLFVKRDLEEVVKETMERDLVYMIFETFVHTDLSAVRVTVVPAVVTITDMKMGKKIFRPSKSITLAISRTDALGVLRKHANIESFDDLCGVWFEGTYAPDWPTEVFSRCMYNDQGPPTLDLIFSELSAASKLSPLRSRQGQSKWTVIAS